jgi:acetyl-CoA C-acetyltransferase
MIDPRTPVIVGTAQATRQDRDTEPIAAMIEAVAGALDRSGARDALARHIGAVRVMQGLWRYRDPGRLVAAELGFGPVQTTMSPIGGNEVYDLVNITAADIQSGNLDVAVLCASEAARTNRRLSKRGERLPRRPEPDDATPDHVYGDVPRFEDEQVAVGAQIPVHFYAMMESAIRHAGGESVDAHRKRIGELWARASEVAAHNPHAATRRILSGDDVATVSPGNRLIALPYTKLMTSNIDVDMSAAVVMCSLGTARAAGIADDDLVFLTAGAGASDHESVTERWVLHEPSGMRIAGRRVLELAGRTIDTLDDLDLYSCFPSAVQVAQHSLAIDPARPYTVTGGLTFAGGPFNSYCLHALATACDRIRDGRARSTLLTGNGGYFSKHSFTALSAEPPAAGFRCDRPQDEVDVGPRRPRPTATPPTAELETYTVTHDRDGQPTGAIVTALDAHGSRHWATGSRTDVIGALLDEDRIGSKAHLARTPEGRVEVTQIA